MGAPASERRGGARHQPTRNVRRLRSRLENAALAEARRRSRRASRGRSGRRGSAPPQPEPPGAGAARADPDLAACTAGRAGAHLAQPAGAPGEHAAAAADPLHGDLDAAQAAAAACRRRPCRLARCRGSPRADAPPMRESPTATSRGFNVARLLPGTGVLAGHGLERERRRRAGDGRPRATTRAHVDRGAAARREREAVLLARARGRRSTTPTRTRWHGVVPRLRTESS